MGFSKEPIGFQGVSNFVPRDHASIDPLRARNEDFEVFVSRPQGTSGVRPLGTRSRCFLLS